jgi:AmmeMemoRadiSam system protein B/AmmeMemoRadiSam system protein A
MIRQLTIHLILCALGFTLYTGNIQAQQTASVNRQPVFAGSFYPGSKQALESALKELYAASSPKQLEGAVRCLIVPHAGYSYSGRVAASGYKSIPRDAAYENIFIIASSHRSYFEGASVYSVGNYLTPLGEALVNRTIARELIAKNMSVSYNASAHDREHSIEVQVPLIQYHFEKMPPIVPIVIGSSSVSVAKDLAAALLPYFTPENLFVISSDFSHYPGYDEATRIDQLTGDAILQNDPEIFYNTLRKNSTAGIQNLATPCCGWSSVLTLLYMSEKDPQLDFAPILYQNSGDTPIGDKDRVVGYWAIAGHESPSKMTPFVLNEQDKTSLLDISRETLDTYIRTGEIPEVASNEIPEILRQPAGAFVSLYKHGQLRGCIGNFLPDQPLYKVVQHMTVAASTRDTRFYPVDPWELEDLSIEISVLTPLQKIENSDEFQLGRHGIYMRKNGKSGTYLPQVAEQTGWNTEEFLGHCAKDKAKIGWNGWKDADLYVYEAIVFGEQH